MAQLHVETGAGQVQVVDLADRAVSFGRDAANDVVLTEPKASRRHCTFRPIRPNDPRAGWRVVDEQSSNGTWLGGRPVLAARLQPGDEVEIGETVITYAGQPSELPPSGLARPRRVRKAHRPWGALIGAGILAVVCWVFSGSLASDRRGQEAEGWKRVALAAEARAMLARDAESYRAVLAPVSAELATHPNAADARTILDAAIARGLPPAPPPRKTEWARSLEQVEAARVRLSPGERRVRLRNLLTQHSGDAAAVAAIATVIRGDEVATRERDAAVAADLLARADAMAAEGRLGAAVTDWIDWRAKAPVVTREQEREVARKMAEVRARAAADAEAARVQYGEHMKEGRLAAANSLVDATVERLRGTGYDAWLAAQTRRSEGSGGIDVPGPTARGPRETDDARARRLAKEKLERTRATADALARRRRFADAAVALGEAAAEVADPALQAELRTQADDLSSAADALAAVLRQVREDAVPFGSIPIAEGGGAAATAKVAGATDAAVIVAGKDGASREMALESLPAAAFAALLDKATLEAPTWVGAALLLHEVGELGAYTKWMRKAVSVDDAAQRLAASAVHARRLGTTLPADGYFPHPTDARAIVSGDERRRIENADKIAAWSATLSKVVEKIEASKQAKQVEVVAKAYAELEQARRHALELIYDETRYFYPYKHRWKEYAPVQKDVAERVAAVREKWEEKSSAKVRTDAALDKLLKQADDLVMEITLSGGDPVALTERVERVRMYLGKDLTVQTFFLTPGDQALLDYNREMMDRNAKLKGDVSEQEREQVRITNEYRRMMGHRRALRLHSDLVHAARGHSKDMSDLGFFDHTSPVQGKATPMDRMLLAGYPNTPCSENIASRCGDAQGAHNAWFTSSGHHRNLLMPGWSEMGSGQAGALWTQNFGFASGDDHVGGLGPQ